MQFISSVMSGLIVMLVMVLIIAAVVANAAFLGVVIGFGAVGALLGLWHGRTLTRDRSHPPL